MKWKCTTPKLLSIPVAAAAIGFAMTAVAEQDGLTQSTATHDASHKAPVAFGDRNTITPGSGPMQRYFDDSAGLDDIGCGQMVTQNTDPKTIVFPNVPVCNGAETVETWIARTWNPGELSSVCAFKFGIGEVQGAQAPTSIDVFIKHGSAAGSNPGAMPLVCPPVTVPIPGGNAANGQFFTVKFDPTCNPDPGLPVTIALRIEAPVGSGTFVFPAGNNLGQSAPTYIASGGCGINTYVTTASIGFADAMVLMQVFDGEGEPTPGACCLPKEDGEDQGCIDNVFAGECIDLGGIFHSNATCDGVTCPTQVECPEDDCPPCVGDINGDNVVNGDDLLILLSCWAPNGPIPSGCECADLSGDGVIDGNDLLILLGNWGSCPQASGGGGDVFDENEPCGQRLNDGCNMDDPTFMPINCGDTVCGTAWTAVEFEDDECPGDQGHIPGSCGPDGQHCGGQSTDGCWCDAACWTEMDCCIDICEECFGAQEVNVRDTDWYSIVVKEPKQNVTWRVHAEFPATAIIGWAPPDCDLDEIVIIASASGQPKVPFEISACLQPDIEYFLFIAPTNFTGLPCEGEAQWGDAYTAEVICNDGVDCPKGACCFGEDCLENYDEVLCGIDGGLYQGDGTDCAGNPCELPVGACCLNDGVCVDVNIDECINDLEGAYRGNGTTCADTVPLDIGCNGSEQMVPICRDCNGGQVWCNLQDVCDEDINQDPFNGGCNYWDPAEGEFEAAFEQICCGDLVGGSVWSIQGEGRDLDWRHLTIKEESVVTISIDHGFGQAGLNAILFIARAGCPSNIVTSAAVASGGALVRQMEPGNYYVIVAPEFSTGNNIECGTTASQYQLQVSCGVVDDTVCQGSCGFNFISHPGYPGGGFCSCDPDSCVPLGGTTDDQTEHCCPGICNFCDGFVCEVICTYSYDTQELNTGIGLDNPDAAIGWMHRHNAGAGDTLTEIRTSYFATAGLAAGNPVGFAVYAADANGAPQMPALHSGMATIASSAIDSEFELERQVFSLPNVAVSGEFFVAVWTQGSFPAPSNADGYDPAIANNIWVFGHTGGTAQVDPDNLFATSLPPTILTQANPVLEYVWLLCATGDE